MTKPKYSSAEERRTAQREKAQRQMLLQWEVIRAQTGEELGYFGCHRRVRSVRGRAGDQTCPCGNPAHDWAHIHETDPADPQNYRPMCRSCHFAYDEVTAKAKATLGPEGRSLVAQRAWDTKRAKS